MSRIPQRIAAFFLAVLSVLCLLSATAAKTEAEKASLPMQTSKRNIVSILSEENEEIRAALFSEFVQSRLKYATVRSLSKSVGGKWLGYVDICEAFENGEHAAYVLEQGMVQYGYHTLPAHTNSAVLTVGEVTAELEYDGQAVFEFEPMELGEDAVEADVLLSVRYFNNDYEIELNENYPGSALDQSEALEAMAEAYAEFVSDSGSYQLIDHTVLKLKSYISNYESNRRSYYWELYLVHGVELPAAATLIRYYVSSDSVRIYDRTLRSYF